MASSRQPPAANASSASPASQRAKAASGARPSMAFSVWDMPSFMGSNSHLPLRTTHFTASSIVCAVASPRVLSSVTLPPPDVVGTSDVDMVVGKSMLAPQKAKQMSATSATSADAADPDVAAGKSGQRYAAAVPGDRFGLPLFSLRHVSPPARASPCRRAARPFGFRPADRRPRPLRRWDGRRPPPLG